MNAPNVGKKAVMAHAPEGTTTMKGRGWFYCRRDMLYGEVIIYPEAVLPTLEKDSDGDWDDVWDVDNMNQGVEVCQRGFKLIFGFVPNHTHLYKVTLDPLGYGKVCTFESLKEE